MAAVRHYVAGTPTTATPTVNVPSTAAGDIVVVLDIGNYASVDMQITAVSGLGGTWARVPDSRGQTLSAWICADPAPDTATRTITSTATTLATGTNRLLVAVVVSGATATTAASSVIVSAGWARTALLDATDGQVVIGAGYSADAAEAIAELAPVNGWTEHGPIALYSTTRWADVATRAPATAAAHQVSAHRTGSHSEALAVVVGSPAAAGSTMKVWDGAAWVDRPLRRWNGTGWVSATLRRWDGATWV